MVNPWRTLNRDFGCFEGAIEPRGGIFRVAIAFEDYKVQEKQLRTGDNNT